MLLSRGGTAEILDAKIAKRYYLFFLSVKAALGGWCNYSSAIQQSNSSPLIMHMNLGGNHISEHTLLQVASLQMYFRGVFEGEASEQTRGEQCNTTVQLVSFPSPVCCFVCLFLIKQNCNGHKQRVLPSSAVIGNITAHPQRQILSIV